MDLSTLGFGPFFSAQFQLLDRPDLAPARVIADGRGVFPLGGVPAALGELSGKLLHTLSPSERPVVGDWLAVQVEGDHAIAHAVLDRRTRLVRRAAGSSGEPQVIAANVDVFFVVTSANRDFNPRRLERYVTLVWDSGATPIVVINKSDLGGDLDAMRAAVEEVAFGVPIVFASGATGEGVAALAEHLAPGTTAALIGSSGVGKSTLTNRLLGGERATRAIRDDGKGRHTTTRRELVVLPTGGVLIDTPGMRELGLVSDGGVDVTFADVLELAEDCRFRDCGHGGEPGCAVDMAVRDGRLPASRLRSYHKLQREVAALERRHDPVHAGRAKRRWKAVHLSMRERMKVDPKFKE